MTPILFDETFNWLTVLEEILAGRALSEAECDGLYTMAANWPTCACGLLCRDLPRGLHGAPEDAALALKGAEFAIDIRSRQWSQALLTFHVIEARTSELLALTETTTAPPPQ